MGGHGRPLRGKINAIYRTINGLVKGPWSPLAILQFAMETMAIEIVDLPIKHDFAIAMLNYRNVMGSEALLYHDHLWFRSSHHYDPPSAIEP